jgi:hypothetical protein
MAKRIQLRRDTAANWDRINPILAQGEVAIDLTNKNLKIGNGLDRWDTLKYAVERGKISSIDENTYIEVGELGTDDAGYIFIVNEGVETVSINPSLLTVNVSTLFNASVPSDDPYTGTVVVQGGVGITGDLNVLGEIKANSVYIEDYITADVVGNVTGNVFGDVIGDVYSSQGVKILENGTNGTNAVFTGFVSGNITSTGTSTFSNIDVNGGAIDGTVIGATQPNLITGTTITGDFINATTSFNGNLIGSLRGDIFADNGVGKILDNGTDGTDAVFTGKLVGNNEGNLIGDVYAANGTSKILENGTNGTDAVLTGNVSGNITSTGTSTFSNIDVNGGAIDGTIIGASNANQITGTIITATVRFQGDFQGSFIGNLTGNVLNDDGSLALEHGTTANGNEAKFTGDIYASDGTTRILDNGTGIIPAEYIGNVTGDVTADHIETNTLTTNDDVTINGNLFVDGSGDFTGNITAPNLLYDGTNFIIASPSKFTVETATGNTVIEGTLSVTGDSTFTGDMTAGNIDASTLDTTGNITIGGDLTVAGTSTFADITAADLTIDNLQVNVDANIDGNISIGTDLSVTGLSTFTGNMTAGNIDSTTLDVSNDVTIGEDLTVTGITTLNGTLDVNNTSDFSGNVTLSDASDLAIKDAAGTPNIVFSVDGATGDTYVGGTLNVIGTSTFTGDMTAGNIDASTLDTTGNVSIGGTLAVTSDTTLSGDLAVNGGDLTTTSSTFNLINANATTVNFAGAGTTIEIGASTGTTNINNNLDVDGNAQIDGNTVISGTLTVQSTSLFVGDMTAGNIDSVTLDATGDVSIGGDLSVTGTSTFTGDMTAGNIDASTLDTTGNVSIGGDLSVTGTSTFTGDMTAGNIDASTLDATGDVSVGGDLSVTGTSSFTGDMTAGNIDASTLDTTGNVSIGGNTSLTGTLGVTGTSSFTGDMTAGNIDASTLDTTGNVSIGGTLGVNGTSAFTGDMTAGNIDASTLDTTGDVTVGDNLTVTGDTSITGSTTLNGTLDVNSTSDFSGNVTLSNASDLTIIDNQSPANAVFSVDGVSGNTTVGGVLTVVGTSSFVGTISVGDLDAATIDTTGDVNIGGNLTVTGTTTLNDTLDVNASTDFSGNVVLSDSANFTMKTIPQILGGITVTPTKFTIDGSTGNTATEGTLSVVGTSSFTGDMTAGDISANDIDANTVGTISDVTVGGNLSVTGTSTFTGDVGAVNVNISNDLTVTGDVSVTGTSSFTGDMTAGNIDASTLDTTGDVSIGGDLTVTGTSSFTGDMTAGNIDASTLDTTGDVSVGGNTSLTGTLAVTGTSSFTGDMTAGNIDASTLDTTGDVSIGGDLSVTGTSSFTGDMTAGNIDASTLDTTGDVSVGGNTSLTGTLAVTGTSSFTGDMTAGNIDASTLDTTGDVSVGGNTSLTGTLAVTGTSSFTGDMTAGNIDASTLDTTDDVSVGGDLTVTGTFGVTGNFTAGNITATGNVLVQGTLEVLGETTFKNNFEVIRANPSDPETVTTLERTDITDLNVSGVSELVGNVFFNGTLTVQDTNLIPNVFFTVDGTTGNVLTEGTLTVESTTTLNNILDVNDTSDFSASVNLSAAADFTVQNAAATPVTVFSIDGATGNVLINGTLGVTGTSSFTGDMTAGNIDASTLDTTGNVNITGNLDVTGTSTLATVDINAGNIDNTIIGAAIPAAITATDIEAENITITNEGILKLQGSVNPTYIGFKAPANFVTSTTYELPGIKGLDGYVLTLNTSGDKLEWASPDLFGGGQVAVSADYGDDLFDGINRPVRSIKRALQIASGLVYDINGIPNEKRIIISVASGDYIEDNPIIIPDNVSVVGAGLRACNIRPLNANKDMLRVRNGCYFTEITFRDFLDADKKPSHTFDYTVSFDDPSDIECSRVGYTNLPTKKPTITISPYVQNCSIISFLGGNGVLVDGRLVNVPNKPMNAIEVENPPVGGIPVQGKSMVANAFTMLSFGGTGWRVINDAYAQIVSCFQIFCLNGSYCQSGGYLSITNSATNFGKFALRASGYSPNAFEFDRGIVVEFGTATIQQTITAIGFGSTPVQDYVIRFRSPIFRQAYDILKNKKDDLKAYVISWINNEIATAAPGSVWDGFSYDTVLCGRDVEYIVDAIAYDILSGGNSKSIEVGYVYVESTDLGFTSELPQAILAITELKSEVAGYMAALSLDTTTNTLFDYILDIIATPSIVLDPIESSNVGDITNTFINNLASDKVSFNTAVSVDIASNTFTIIADPQPFTEGQAVIYNSEGNAPIVGLNNEQTYYINVLNYNPSTDIFTFRLFYDDSMTTLVDLRSTGIGTHAFIKNVREFYIDDLVTNHNEYQILTLPVGTYEFVTGRLVNGDDGDVYAYVYSYDPDTRKLTLSIEQQEINGLLVRNFFSGTSKIDYDHSATPVVDIQLQGTAYIDFRNDLFTTKFRISSTVLGDAFTNTANIPENQIWLHRPSIVNSSGHTWEYAGSGIDYNALPQNGGKTIFAYEQVSDLPGRVYSSGTNELGDFKVGNFIKAENKTGNVTFTNTVSIAELDTLKLRIGDVVIQEISADIGLGDNEIGGAKHSRLSTQKAMRDFLQNRLGKFIDKDLATNTKPSAVVQLNSSGKINADLIPAVRNFVIYRENGYRSRLLLVEEVPPVNILNGDLVTETYSTVELTLDNPITASDGDVVLQAISLASGIVFGNVTGSTTLVVASAKATFDINFNTVDELSINGVASGATPDIVDTVSTDQTGNYILAEAIRTQFLLLAPNVNYDFTGITSVKGAINKTEAAVDSIRYGVIANYTSLTPGDGYSPSPGNTTYEFVPLTSVTGIGTGAYADITVTNGVVSALTLRRGGTGYAVNDILSANASDIGGTVNTPFTITVSIIQKRLYVTYSSSVKFEASVDIPEYIEDANAVSQSLTATSTTAKTFNAASDVNYSNSRITVIAHGFENGDPIKYGVGTLVIGGMVNGNVYFAKAIDVDTIEVYSNYTLTNKVNFTSSGLGTHSFTINVVDIEGNTLFIPDHGFSTGTALRINGTNLPTGEVDNNTVAINNNDIFFVGSVTTNSFTLHQLRSTALASVSGLTLGVFDLISTGSGTITFTEQNVVVQGTVDTSSATVDVNNVPINWSNLSSNNIDAANIVTGIINPSRLAQTGSANSDTFLRGDNAWTEVVQTLKSAGADSAISITGSFKTIASQNQFYGPVTLDVYKVDSSPIFSDPLDPYSNLGVAKFRRDQFTIGTGPTTGQVFITPAISGGTIDAKTVEGNDINYILSSSNHSTQPVIKGGTGFTDYTIGDIIYSNGLDSLAKLAIGGSNYILTSSGSAPQWSTNITVNDLNVLGNISQSGSVSTLTAYDIRMSDNNIELGSVTAQTGKTGVINDVTASSSTVTMTGLSTTDGMIPGMSLTKVSGLGSFGTNAVVTQINSATQFTFKADTNNVTGTITFNASGASDSTADGGGITIKSSTGNNKTLQWIKNTPAWTANDNFNIPTGKEYKVDGVTVLSSTEVLGKGFTGPVGEIVTSGSYWTRTFALMGA